MRLILKYYKFKILYRTNSLKTVLIKGDVPSLTKIVLTLSLLRDLFKEKK